MRRRVLPLVAIYGLLAGLGACDVADNPIAPTGSVLNITAMPTRIQTNQTSTLTVTGFRPDGNPLSSGIQLRLSTTLGSVPRELFVGSNGRATALLTPDGRTGRATVTAVLPGDISDDDVTATVSVEIVPVPGQAPVVTITSPMDGAVIQGGAVTLIATATDAEDGNLASGITWSSSLDGDLGTGASITPGLSLGTHTLTASATDSGGLTGSATITVTVTAPPAAPVLQAMPMRLDKDHPRGGATCPDPFAPVDLTAAGGPLDFRIPLQDVDWLSVVLGEGNPLASPFGGPMRAAGPLSGPVPAVLQLAFTCDVGAGDLDLQHDLVIQGVDPATGADVGDPVLLDVNVRVR